MIKKFDAHTAYAAFYDKHFINDPEINQLLEIQERIEDSINQVLYEGRMLSALQYDLEEFHRKFPKFALMKFVHAIRLSLMEANIPYLKCDLDDTLLFIEFKW